VPCCNCDQAGKMLFMKCHKLSMHTARIACICHAQNTCRKLQSVKMRLMTTDPARPHLLLGAAAGAAAGAGAAAEELAACSGC
jgi:hypothetical protein